MEHKYGLFHIVPYKDHPQEGAAHFSRADYKPDAEGATVDRVGKEKKPSPEQELQTGSLNLAKPLPRPPSR